MDPAPPCKVIVSVCDGALERLAKLESVLVVAEADPAPRDAFERLAPGCQRGYVLYFRARVARIERVRDRIIDGF